MRTRKALSLMLAFGTLLALGSPAEAGTLTGREVLDLDGSIVRKNLESQAAPVQSMQAAPNATAARATPPANTPQFAAPPPPARRSSPPRTLTVLGTDASAIGGPVTLVAYVRWNGDEFPVRVGTVVNGYQVTHIDQAGTDLVAVRGKARMHIPREAFNESEAAPAAPRAPATPRAPFLPTGSVQASDMTSAPGNHNPGGLPTPPQLSATTHAASSPQPLQAAGGQ